MKRRTLRAEQRAQRRNGRALPPVSGSLDRADLLRLAYEHQGAVAAALREALRREGER